MADRMTLALDRETRDLVIDSSGMMQCVYDGEAVCQNIRNCLLTWRGEFPLHTGHGTAWDRVAGKPALEAEDQADDVVRAAIFQEPCVREISELTVRTEGRGMEIGFSGVLYDGSAVRMEVSADG